MNNKKAFTLIEILISILLLSLVMLALYNVLDTQRRAVYTIKHHLDKSIKQDRVIMTLYYDIARSDGNITLKKSERDTLCINHTQNSLYGLGEAKVCWLVLKEHDSLARIEGNDYTLPLGLEDKVAIDIVAKGISLFDIYRNKEGNILVLLQEAKKEPYSFLLQGITMPPKQKTKSKKENNSSKSGNTPNKKDDIIHLKKPLF